MGTTARSEEPAHGPGPSAGSCWRDPAQSPVPVVELGGRGVRGGKVEPVCACTRTHTRACTHAHTHMYTHTCVHTHVHAHMYIHTHVHTHTHARVHRLFAGYPEPNSFQQRGPAPRSPRWVDSSGSVPAGPGRAPPPRLFIRGWKMATSACWTRPPL